jgi:hypothetical protein
MSSDPEAHVVCVSKMCPVTHLPAGFSTRCQDDVIGKSLGMLDHRFYLKPVTWGKSFYKIVEECEIFLTLNIYLQLE